MPKTKVRIDALGNALTSYLVFDDVGASPSGKTRRIVVKNTSGELLGGIEWRAGWRRYVFFPHPARLVLDAACLRELAEEIDAMMAAHKSKGTK